MIRGRWLVGKGGTEEEEKTEKREDWERIGGGGWRVRTVEERNDGKREGGKAVACDQSSVDLCRTGVSMRSLWDFYQDLLSP